MFSRTRWALAELEATVDDLRGQVSGPVDAVLADTLLTLGDAIAEVDRILLDLHRELTRRQRAGPPSRPGPTVAPARFTLVATAHARPL